MAEELGGDRRRSSGTCRMALAVSRLRPVEWARFGPATSWVFPKARSTPRPRPSSAGAHRRGRARARFQHPWWGVPQRERHRPLANQQAEGIVDRSRQPVHGPVSGRGRGRLAGAVAASRQQRLRGGRAAQGPGRHARSSSVRPRGPPRWAASLRPGRRHPSAAAARASGPGRHAVLPTLAVAMALGGSGLLSWWACSPPGPAPSESLGMRPRHSIYTGKRGASRRPQFPPPKWEE